MEDRLAKAQEVRDYILANKDIYGRMFNQTIPVRNGSGFDMPWVNANERE